ncbi:MAG: hypothetical protein JSV25_11855 [Spirochaetota bacterium]|nr:MAG: hypothetical protein JSV25_11855 [Spirochaetota bacterium]
MSKYIIQLNEEDVIELKGIAIDRDHKQAFEFLRKKILSQVEKKNKSRMNVEGKTHL